MSELGAIRGRAAAAKRWNIQTAADRDRERLLAILDTSECAPWSYGACTCPHQCKD